MMDKDMTVTCPQCGEEVHYYRIKAKGDGEVFSGPAFFRGHGDNYGCMGGHTKVREGNIDE